MPGEPIYGLSLYGDGVEFKAGGAGSAMGGSGYFASALGTGYADVFAGSRAPAPRELIQQAVGTIFACSALNSDMVAGAKLRLMLRTRHNEPKGKDYLHCQPVDTKTLKRVKSTPALSRQVAGADVEEVTDHPLLDLLQRPNPNLGDCGLSGFDLRWVTQLYLELIGRAYWLVIRDGLGVPTELWALRAHYVVEVPDPDGEAGIIRYEYGTGPQKQIFTPDNIIRFHFPDPENPYLGGYSPTAAAIEQVRISRYLDAATQALLRNMARPDAVFIPKGDSEGGGIGSPEAQRLRTAMRAQFAQAGRGQIMVSPYPGSLEVLQWKPMDVVELERAKAIKTNICNVFGVPDAKLERNAANLASAETADYAHKVDAGLPRCRRIESRINTEIVPLFDGSGRLFVMHDLEIPEDKEHLILQTRNGAEYGAITRNELRAGMGLPDEAWGDVPLVVNNMVAVDMMTGEPKAAPQPPQQPDSQAGRNNGKPTKPPKKSRTSREIRALTKAVAMMVEGISKGARTNDPPILYDETRERNSRTVGVADVAAYGTCKAAGESTGVRGEKVSDSRAGQAGRSNDGCHLHSVKSRLAAAGYSEEEIAAKLNPRRNGHPVEL